MSPAIADDPKRGAVPFDSASDRASPIVVAFILRTKYVPPSSNPPIGSSPPLLYTT